MTNQLGAKLSHLAVGCLANAHSTCRNESIEHGAQSGTFTQATGAALLNRCNTARCFALVVATSDKEAFKLQGSGGQGGTPSKQPRSLMSMPGDNAGRSLDVGHSHLGASVHKGQDSR